MNEGPVEAIPGDDLARQPTAGIGLCLSGGGYRAMVFHLGVLWRLYDAGVLNKLARISSVSGGSITAAVLGLNWHELSFDPAKVREDFNAHIVVPVRRLAGKTIDVGAIIRGLALRGPVSRRIARAYDKHLFSGATLQDLPDAPRFVINATNIQSGVLWRFMKPYMRDYRVGEVKAPALELAAVVAASSAFPPFLSPAALTLDPADFTPDSGHDLQREPYTRKIFLSDGGVYDNLGLETVWKRYQTVLVSDAGGQMGPQERPKSNWACHSYRVLQLVDNQVRALRKRQLISSYLNGERQGAFWSIRTDIADYGLPDALDCPHARTLELARTPTRLKRLDAALQERLVNWGYAVCDAALRRHTGLGVGQPVGFPYPDQEV